MQISCLPWSHTDPRLHGWFIISGSAQESCCHSTSKQSWLLSHQAGQAAELSLIQLLCRPSLHHTQVPLLEHNSSSLTPKMSMRKPKELPRMAARNRGHKPLLPPERHKGLSA